jgi:hypothetical protein
MVKNFIKKKNKKKRHFEIWCHFEILRKEISKKLRKLVNVKKHSKDFLFKN